MTGRRTLVLVMSLLWAVSVSGATAKRVSERPRVVRPASEKRVTLDLKDAPALEVLTSMQKQCGVKNLVLDPNVQARGTFYFSGVPCATAFRVAFETLGVQQATPDGSAILHVRTGTR